MASRNDDRNDTTACPACGQLFTRVGRRRWCSDACRQAGWRRRRAVAAELPVLPRPAREHTVYECPDCQARYLGPRQRCDDCGVFCRRVGPGGECPACGEAVAVSDLLEPDPASMPAVPGRHK